MDFNWQLRSPACLMISGATSTGKTQLTKRLLQRCNEVFDKPVSRIQWCFTEQQPELEKELKATVPNIDFHCGFPEGYENPNPNNHEILVLDDMMHLCKNEEMQAVFLRGSHHQNVSCIYLTQNMFAPGQRTISLQCKYITILNNPRENSNFQVLGRQMNNGKNDPALEEAAKDLANKPYSYIVIDYDQNQDNRMRIRNSFFPEDMIVYMKK